MFKKDGVATDGTAVWTPEDESPVTGATDVVIANSEPPDGGYGWVCCGAVSLLNGFTWGIAAVCCNSANQSLAWRC